MPAHPALDGEIGSVDEKFGGQFDVAVRLIATHHFANRPPLLGPLPIGWREGGGTTLSFLSIGWGEGDSFAGRRAARPRGRDDTSAANEPTVTVPRGVIGDDSALERKGIGAVVTNQALGRGDPKIAGRIRGKRENLIAGQQLIVNYRSVDLFDLAYGNVTLPAATLQGGSPVVLPFSITNAARLGDDFVLSF